jgi:hypothetical protein
VWCGGTSSSSSIKQRTVSPKFEREESAELVLLLDDRKQKQDKDFAEVCCDQ